ncbi:MAG: hypothetical protein R6U68_17050 [Desulfobacteraceae bacterium]
MGQAEKKTLTIQKMAENLASFAIDREDIKMLIQAIPENCGLNLTQVEYELQILKILSVGWAVSFYMPQGDQKKALTRLFWEYIREISKNISNITETTTGTSIDYFSILKERLDTYVKKMQENQTSASEPSVIMGPAFAEACTSPENAVAILTGTKMFTLTLGSIKEYLNSVTLE